MLTFIIKKISGLNAQIEDFFEDIIKNKGTETEKDSLFNLDQFYDIFLQLGKLDKNFLLIVLFIFILYLCILLRKGLATIITHYLKKVLSSFANKIQVDDDPSWVGKLQQPVQILIPSLTANLLLFFAPIPEEEKITLANILYTLHLSLILWIIFPIIDISTHFITQIANRKNLPIRSFIPIIEKSVRILVGMLGIIMIMDKLGVNTMSIVAFFGVVGAAFAFASKDTIANMYNSFINKVDSPFKVNDWVQIGANIEGQVIEIGLRSTKICTETHTVASIPNTVIAREPIKKWDAVPKRRVKQILTLPHQTHSDTIVQIVEKIQALLKSNEAVDPAFLLVNCVNLSGESIDILLYYFTRNGEWSKHMGTRQRINIEIMRILEYYQVSLVYSSSVKVGNFPEDEGREFPD